MKENSDKSIGREGEESETVVEDGGKVKKERSQRRRKLVRG